MTNKIVKKETGRKLFDGKDEEIVIQKLEQVWAMGGTDEEASAYADISKAALSDYIKKNTKVSERKALLKQRPFLKARKTIVDSLDEPNSAKWFMEHKKNKEFTTRTETSHSGKISHEVDPKKQEEIDDLIDEN